MIITLANAGLCFEEILKLLKGPQDFVLIFTSFDVDSLCTLRIITYLLKINNKQYSIFPVLSVEQMEKKIIESEGSPVKAFVLINCGGSKDINNYWFSNKDNIVCLLMDSHRPIHHNNIHSKKNILIIDDGQLNLHSCPTDEGIIQ